MTIVASFLFDLDQVPSWESTRATLLRELVIAGREGEAVAATLREGGVLLHNLAYTDAELTVSEGGRRSSLTRVGRPEVWAYLLAELRAALEDGRHTTDPEEVEQVLRTLGMEAMSLGYLTEEQTARLDGLLRGTPGYLGTVTVDRAHPLLYRVLWAGLIPIVEIKDTRIWLLDTPGSLDEERYELVDEPAYWWSEVGAESLGWTNSLETEHEHPTRVEPLPRSKRGARFVEGYERLTAPTPVQRALASLPRESPDAPAEFTVDARRVPGREDAVVAESKLRGYLLNPDHEKGGPKARLFSEALGIDRDDWQFLAEQLRRGVLNAPLYETRRDAHGVKFHTIVAVQGRNGEVKPVLAAWVVRPGEAPSLVTAYLAKRGTAPDTEVFDVALPRPGEEIAFEDLWALASQAADDAAALHVPIPMKVVGPGTASWVSNGEEGVASVRVFDARRGFGKWLRNEGLGHAGHLSGSWLFAPPRGYQPAKVWAETFVEVLSWHGIGCEVHASMT
ncbi:MAG: hypothetical protein J7518_20880 [Nocardioidaceae bacterium]|nr:hypothetical protein [Nocardioidaceae bacterium]